MGKSFVVIFRLTFLIIYISSLLAPLGTISASPAPSSVSETTNPASDSPEPDSALVASAAPGPDPAAGGSTIASVENFTPKNSVEIAAELKLLGYTNPTYATSRTTGGLQITPITAYNLIVDSNVLSPSSYGPSAATVGAQYCNNTGSPMTNVWAYVGNFNGDNDATLDEPGDYKPGLFPVRDENAGSYDPATFATAYGLATTNPLVGKTSSDHGDGNTFALKFEGGSLGASDASRYIGTLAAGECRTEYWLVSYPRKARTNSGTSDWVTVTGSVKPEDDLWLPYFFWGSSSTTGTSPSYIWRPVTMRNEISAMANKIWPNGDNKVPPEYVAAIQMITGWSTWTPSGSGVAYPGQVVTSQGIWYDFGNVGAGFDNNGDFAPDRNAWVQPIGDAGTYDPGCFRLIKTYGLVIVKLNDGTEMLIPFVDQMYFENIPDNNNGAVGLVYYQYVALDGACSAGLTPYQEVASGYDNEKFNGDFGAGTPPLQSTQSNMTISKTGPNSVASNSTVNYSLTFTLPDASTNSNPAMTISVGVPSLGTPLVYEDTIPSGMAFIGPVSPVVTMANYSSATLNATLFYSTDSGATWSTTAPATGTVSTSPNNLIKIQWWMPEAITQKSSGNGNVTGTVSFSATSPNLNPPPMVTNTGCLKLGNGPSFTCGSATTQITGAYSISGTVFCDDGTQTSSSGPCSTGTAASTLGNGTLDAVGGEPGMPNVSVYLYYDSNGSGAWDSTDSVVDSAKVTDASGNYSFTSLTPGKYFTKVITSDTDIQSTYGITTPDTRTATITTANITGLNFGYAPPLTVNKALHSSGPFYVGDTIYYNITLNNNLPGGTGSGNSCTYTIWSSIVVPDGSSIPAGGGSTNAQWLSATSAGGKPDGVYAYTDLANNLNQVGLKGFNIDPNLLPGTITKVEFLVDFNVRSPLANDATFTVVTYYNNLASTSTAPVYNGSAFPGVAGTPYRTVYDISGLKTWTAADFANNSTGLQIQARKGAGSNSGNINMDAAAFLVTTNQPCPNSSATTLNPLPLTDTFDNTKFTFVSAEPPINSTASAGNITTLTWNNVGPVPAGSYKTVEVYLKAIAAGTNISDTVTSTNPKFADGRLANNGTASALTTVLAATANGLISGRIFDDNAPLNGWVFNTACTPGSATGPNCTLQPVDTALENVRVNLLACVDAANGSLVTTAGTNKLCEDQGGSWVTWATTFTDGNGDYTFSNLRQGFYRAQVDITTIPGAVQQADPNVTAGTCGAGCDNQSYGALRLDQVTFGHITGSDSFYNVNFGYNFSDSTYSAGDEVYFDWDGDGIRDAGDELIPGATLRLLDVVGNQLDITTVSSPAAIYNFTGLRNGIYTIQVSSLPAIPLSQTGDPEQPGVTCTSCDNLTTFTLNGANDTVRDFGYQPSGTAVIGDTVWKDMNGDGFQSGTQETSIPNITVNLLVDFDGNGTWVTAKTTSTDASGKYQFANLPDGTYRVQVDTADAQMPKDAFGVNYISTNGSLYTNITVAGGVVTSMTNPASGITSITANGFGDAVENDPLNLDADFGFAPLASIGDTVYWDSNANGTQDTVEPGINGVTVRLYTFVDAPDGKYTSGEVFTDNNGNGRWDTGEPFTDSLGNSRYDPGETLSGSPVGTTTTTTINGQDGKYIFSGLDTDKNGVNYVVVVDPASTPIATSVLNGDPSADGIPTNCAVINLASANCDARDGMKLFPGSNYTGADFGFLPLGSFGDTLWVDPNNNGKLDLGEAGIPNITVTAVTANNVTINGINFPSGTTLTTSTDANGNYSFQNIIAIGASATWTVTVNTADTDFPAGLTQTYDPDGTLSNSTTVVISTTGVVTTVGGCSTLPSGCDSETDALNLDADFGYDYSGLGALSGTICLDAGYTTAAANTTTDNVGVCGMDRADTSGVGTGEAAYDNVTVYLYRWIDTDNDSVIDPGETTQIAVTGTDANGDFSFTNIPDAGGVYYIVAVGAPQSGMELTTQTGDSLTVGDNAKEIVVESNPTVSGVDYVDVSAYEVVLVPAGSTVTNVDFAFVPAGSFDYGDLPDTYSTTLQGVPDGPHHMVSTTPSLYLGVAGATQASLVDANGQPTADATGDGADEDGVTFTYDPADTNWADGVNVTVNVNAYVAAPTAGLSNDAYLVAWMDFNHDGDFADASEMIRSSGVENGSNSFTVSIPTGVLPHSSGTLNSRFRLFSNSETPPIASLAYSGVASSGEVEDYQQKWEMTIDKDTTTANVTPTGNVSYTISLVNTGNQTLSGIQASDNLDNAFGAGLYSVTNVTATGGLTVNFPGYNGSATTNLLSGSNTLAAGANAVITIALTLNNAALGTYDNTAVASSTQIVGTVDDDGISAQDSNTPIGSDPETDEDVTVTNTPLTSSIGDKVWTDSDGSGTLNGAETGINGVVITLYRDNNNDGVIDGTDTNLGTQTTSGNGDYSFPNLPAGNYLVDVPTVTGHVLTTANDPHDVTLVAGVNYTTADFGFRPVSSIGDKVWTDSDGSGTLNGAETGINGVVITLYRDNNNDGLIDLGDTNLGTQTTSGNGDYSFPNLPAGNYLVDVPTVTGHVLTTANDLHDATLVAGVDYTTADFGFRPVSSIGDKVWTDSDGSGTLNGAETGINGVVVTLYRDNNNDGLVDLGDTNLGTQTTSGNGDYSFSNLPAGNYLVDVPTVTGHVLTTANDPHDVTLVAGVDYTTADFGFRPVSSIGDKVWTDSDGSGTLNGAETGINGVVVTLYRDNNNDGVVDGTDTNLGTQTTSGNGDYSFPNLPAGDYLVDVPVVSGHILTTANDPHDVTLVAGVNYTTADFGFRPVSSIGDKVWTDSDGSGTLNGAETGINGVVITLYRDINNDGIVDGGDTNLGTQTTSGNGDYSFPNLPAGNYLVDVPVVTGHILTTGNDPHDVTLVAGVDYTTADFGFRPVSSIGDKVWTDSDGSGTLNGAETGINGVVVTLYRDNNNDGVVDGTDTNLGTQTTSGNGDYNFLDLPAGNYLVDVPTVTGHILTTANDPHDVTLVAGVNYTTADFGFRPVFTISGQVRNDVDNDGDLTDADNGLAGAVITLYLDPDGDGDPTTGGASIVGTPVTTGGAGSYSFINLLPGNYVVVETNPAGYTSTADSAAPNNDRVPVTLSNANSTGNVFLDWINARVQIVKTPSVTVTNSGGSVTYSYVVTNLGAVSLTSVTVLDDKCTPVTYVSGDANTNTTLETTETWNYTCTTTLSATTTNIATVTGKDPLNNTIQDTDSVTVNVISSGLSKTIFGTDTGTMPDFTNGNNVAIGEIVTYEISIDLPAGQAFNKVVVTDRMDKGLAFVDTLLVDMAGTNITGSVLPVVSSITDPGDVVTNPANSGRQVQFNIGDIPALSVASKLTIRYRAIVLDVVENQNTVDLNNNVTWDWTGGSITTSAPEVNIVEPDISIDKSAIPTSDVAIGTPVQFTLTIAHTAQSTANAFDVVVTDILPPTLEYIPCTIVFTGLAPTTPAAPAYCPGAASTLNFVWDSFPLGATATITFNARLISTPAVNSANVAWTSLPIDPAPLTGLPQQLSTYNTNSTERWYDPLDMVNIYSVTDSVTINAPAATGGTAGNESSKVELPANLPSTGFAPGVETILPIQPAEQTYLATGVWLEIPRLGVTMPIVGVPLVDKDWDVSWLGSNAGWLDGTAFPGWEGNSAITGHVTLSNGKSGPFADLKGLKWGDKIFVHAYGEIYTFEVRESRTIKPYNTSVLKHEEESWLTLITCKTYNESTSTYADRTAIRAVLVKVQRDTSVSSDKR